MNRYYFKVTFLSDIVLNASSNTEGKIDVLDYITGSSFLGMAATAKEYDKYNNSFDIFHSGKVRFGEATPLLNGKISYKMPFSFFKPKTSKGFEEVYNNHFADYSDQNILNKQLKQQRSGFITKDLEYFSLDYNYEQKSAFDKENRKSKESSMFGYRAIKKGATWIFNVSFDTDINSSDKNRVLELLEGEKNLGKSKQTQYGRVKIEKTEEINDQIEDLSLNTTTYVYLSSSLALVDENGFSTYNLSKDNLGLKDSSINWENTQIRTREITPYNSVRKTYDSSRLIIEKGSVIALKDVSSQDLEILKSGIGNYLSEGYGQVLINPSFLLAGENSQPFKLQKVDYSYEKESNNSICQEDKELISFLQNRQIQKESVQSVSQKVQEFIVKHNSKFKKVSKSQWGQIRAILQVDKKQYKENIEKFISKGVSEKQWKDGLEIIKKTVNEENIEFLKLLCIQMPKQK